MSDSSSLSGVETTDRACAAMTTADRANGALSQPAESAAKGATSSRNERQTASPQVPRHVAVVMDGNGRWARSRFMPRFFGHKQGVDALVRAVNLFADRGVQYLTVFAFSSENWKRPAEEVTGLMSLVLVAVSKYLSKLEEDGVRIRVVGDRTGVSDKLRWACEQAEEKTRHNSRITLAVAFNYGGRWDVLQACQRALAQGLAPEQLDERWLASQMALSFAPDPDLFIRTGGEMRMSNFLLWQSAYSELFFTDCLWPDFGAAEIDAALQAYASRERRFGGIAATHLPPTDLQDRS
jgi:undecaprenyl diphosphate synthase